MGLKGELYNWYKGGQLGREAKHILIMRSFGVVLMAVGAFWVHPGAGIFLVGAFLMAPGKKDEDVA
jgi:hypothetical protein